MALPNPRPAAYYSCAVSQPASLKPRATYADLERVPDHMVAEILDGELFATPRPALPHAHAGSVLGVEIGGPFGQGRGGPGGWWILDEPELHFGEDVLVPDLAGWRRDRLATIPNDAFMTLAPDWACEVLSPLTERIDRLRKLKIYAREGVAWVWLVNPISQTLEILGLEGGRWMLIGTHGGDEAIHAEPFEAIVLELSRLWPAEGSPAFEPDRI
jgi:Uma2 family endonuclease